ncbi:MAG: hypothetical protein LC797_05330 [Chloroflexi bacterium]|nr:hypothetical protein [Chloroflexota bacterium]
MSEPMAAPRGGWLSAAAASGALILLASAVSAGPLDTLSIDLRHRWVALTARSRVDEASPVDGQVENRLGVNVFLEQEVEPDKRQRSLELLRDAGVGWIRQELPWEQVEPLARGQTTDPNFGGSTWAKFDDIVDRTNGLGLKLIFRLDTSPRWALAADAPDGLGPPTNDADYWEFVSQVATRYRGRVAAYQVWKFHGLCSCAR